MSFKFNLIPFEFQMGVGVFKWNQMEFQMESKEILISNPDGGSGLLILNPEGWFGKHAF